MSAQSPDPGGYRPPPYQRTTWLLIMGVVVLVVGLTVIRTDYQPDSSREYPSRPMLPDAVPVLLPSPEPDDEYLPCSDCHEGEPVDATPREFEDEHDLMDFAHGELWCLDCHGTEDHESLHLTNGTLIAFEDSWRLCTQCHGEKLADWRAGVHGKRTGHWRGTKEYRTCVTCHDPHSPPFEPLKPKPVPLRPDQITAQGPTPDEGRHE